MWDPELTRREPIMLATHGVKDSDSAVATAAQLAERGREIRVVTVVEPAPIVAGEYGFIVPIEQPWEDRRAHQLARVRGQIREVLGYDPKWPIDVRAGIPAPAIANAAAMLDAAFIVMGLGEHNLMDRAIGSETALHTLRSGCTPILAVPPRYEGVLRRAVVGVDFGDACVVAAQQALAALPSLTHVVLVHVAPRWDLQPGEYALWRMEYNRDMAPALARAIEEIGAPPHVNVTTAIREGKTTRELLAAATEQSADVIIVGSKGLGLLDRMLVGSTASGIIRGAQCAVFAMPLAGVATRARRSLITAGAEW